MPKRFSVSKYVNCAVFEANFAVQSSAVHPQRGSYMETLPVKSDLFDQHAAITRKQCEIGHKLVLFTNRKSRTGFRAVPKSLTLSDLERPNGRHHELYTYA